MANFVKNKNVSKSLSITSGPKSFLRRPLKSVASDKWKIRKGTGVEVVSFLIKTIALEALRRFSRAKCPSLWNGLQGLQLLCYPPLKWIQRWKPFAFLARGMQMISRPLLVLSIADAFSDRSDRSNFLSHDTENSPSTDDSELGSENLSGTQSLQCNQRTSIDNGNLQRPLSADWISHLSQELEKLGITLLERMNREELQRFYAAANGNFSTLLASVKKTIRWRETYRILSPVELELWSNMIFWHGLDVTNQPCLIVRLGLACVALPSHERPRFAQAVVSQVEHGILHLADKENPQITVLVDCQGLSPLRFPMQTMRYCCNLLQDHFPNVLGCLIVIRLPSVVRVIAQTFIQVLKPSTKQKLRIEGEPYQRFLTEYFQRLPSYLGGKCTCTTCAKLVTGNAFQILGAQTTATELVSDMETAEDFPSIEPPYQYDTIVYDYCSQILRTALVGSLIVCLLIVFIDGIYNPESRAFLLP